MRKSLIAGLSCLALGLAGTAFAAGSTGSNAAGSKVTGSTNDKSTTTTGSTSGTSNSTTSQREACPPGEVKTGNDTCAKKGQ